MLPHRTDASTGAELTTPTRSGLEASNTRRPSVQSEAQGTFQLGLRPRAHPSVTVRKCGSPLFLTPTTPASSPEPARPPATARRAPLQICAHRLVVLLAACLWPCLTSASPLPDETFRVRADVAQTRVNPWLQVLEDPGHALTVTEVLARQDPKDWRVENNQGRFGFSGASVWLSLRLAPDPDVNGDYLLHLRTPNLSYAALYLLVDGKLRWSAELPEDTPLHARPFRHRQFVFPLQFKPDEQPRLLVKVTPRKNLAMTVPVDLWQTEPFRAADQGQMLFYGVLYGVTSIMALYALVLFFAIRENSHLHFAAFLFSNTLFQANFQGVLTQFCWPERGASLEMALNGTITPFVMATSLGFFAEFSKVGRWFPTTGRLTRYFVYINLGLGSFAPLIGYNTALNASLVGTMLMGWVSFPIAIAAWKHGGRAGRAFVSCLPIFSVGGIALTLRGLGLLPGGFWSEDYQPTSTIAMVLILAFALSDRINQERAERERAQERALEVEKEAAATLQHKVDERTSELANQTRLPRRRGQRWRISTTASAPAWKNSGRSSMDSGKVCSPSDKIYALAITGLRKQGASSSARNWKGSGSTTSCSGAFPSGTRNTSPCSGGLPWYSRRLRNVSRSWPSSLPRNSCFAPTPPRRCRFNWSSARSPTGARCYRYCASPRMSARNEGPRSGKPRARRTSSCFGASPTAGPTWSHSCA